MKGFGFFAGGLLLQVIGFNPALWLMAAMLAIVLAGVVLSVPTELGKAKASKSFGELFAKTRAINLISAARIFHELIADTDFNMTNVLITKDWRIWMIDFSRAFRTTTTVNNPKELTRADRTLLTRMRELTLDGVQQALGRWLTKSEIEGLMARRAQIVQFFDNAIAAKGEAAVLYDLPRTSETCGAGLQ